MAPATRRPTTPPPVSWADVPGFYNRLGVILPSKNTEWVPVRCFLQGHQDRHASSSVNTSSGVFKCFTCNISGSPYKAALARGYTPNDAQRLAEEYGLWRGKQGQQPHGPITTPPAARINWAELTQPEPQPVAKRRREWVYTDEHGQPLSRAVRVDLDTGRKQFWQERWENQQWVTGLKNTRRVLYRLPEVRQRALNRQLVLIVEGEKAVDALDRIGVFATTSPGGAGKWRDEYSAMLAGAIVVPVPDCDPPGRQHAITIVRSLLQHNVTVLGPLEVDATRHDGYDVTDRLTDIARTQTVPKDFVRVTLQHWLLQRAYGLPQASNQTIRVYEELAAYNANPEGMEILPCAACGQDRVHKVKAGVRYCPCGAQQ